LFLAQDLSVGGAAPLNADQAHYLINVLRMSPGGRVLAFNGRDGEFAGTIEAASKKAWRLALKERTRPQPPANDFEYLFAPLKHARLDYMAQKAVEMGASALRPVRTRRTQSQRINLDRLAANAREAAEQCGVLALPRIDAETPLDDVLEAWPEERLLVFCDEDAPVGDAITALRERGAAGGTALIIGPEGGFDEGERTALLAAPNVLRISLGPRILRADTAAVAAMALVQAAIGDWR
jgi:16S rRNA (uracil1498-N3)-methyltransferase